MRAEHDGATQPLRRFVAPRHWPLWLALAALRLVHVLPIRRQLAAGRVLGRLVHRLSPRRARIARRNLELCFPELDTAGRSDIERAHFESVGMSVIELALAWWSSDERLAPLVRFEGLEHLDAAIDRHGSAVILTAHFTTIEIGGRFLKRHLDMFDGVYRENRNPFVDEIIRRARARSGRRLIEKSDIKTMIRSLRAGVSVWYAPDQSYRRKYAELLDFFGEPAMTNTATSRVAALGKAAILPFFCWRESADGRYAVRFLPPIEPAGDDPAIDVTRQYLDATEAMIRLAPEQYYWVHRRFKERPAPLPDVYAGLRS
ncbi:MAG: lipid A biosynthesis acyltransferase [Pseudomonadota bacterium]